MTIRYHKIIHCISSRDYVTIFNHQAMMETAAKRAAAPATSWLEPSSAAGAAGAAGAGADSSSVASPPSVQRMFRSLRLPSCASTKRVPTEGLVRTPNRFYGI